MPNFCYNCGFPLKKKKGYCPNCGKPFVQDRYMQIPREYQAPVREIGIAKIFQDFKNRIETSDSGGSTPSKGESKFLTLIETTDLLDKAFILVAKKVEYLARKEIDVKYGLETDAQPNYCSNCGYKIEGSWKLCPICGKKMVYRKLEYEKAIGYIEKAIDIDPDDHKLKLTLERVQKIVVTETSKDNALFHLRFVGDHHLSQINLISAILNYKPR
ncbi:MAG: hypothetical protein HWN80_09280 [Candidatus Lokiarchaeota archaeon]|nr:hypothetical protein [Candidatus Lokiarchaeota archaeon]